MARDYNEQAPDGSWRHVVQNDNGTYTVTPIAPGGYQAANIPSGGGGGGTYSTQNGPMTVDQMLAGLDSAAGGYWSGDRSNPASVAAAYNQAPAGGGSMSVNLTAAGLAEQQANDAVDAEIKRGQLDLAKLQQTWLQTYQTSLLTGTFNGQPTQATLAQDAGITGVFNGQPTLAAQGQRTDEATRLLQLQSGLSGPANAFKYGQLLTGTPGGLADIVRAAGGAYRLPSTGGGSGEANQPLTIQSMINDIANYSPSSTPAAPPAAPAGSYMTKNGAKTLDQMKAELRVAGWNGDYNDAAAVQAVYASTSGGPVTPAGTNQQAAAQTNQQNAAQSQTANSTAGYVPATGPLPPPNQWNPQNIQNMAPSQRDLFQADYVNQGYLPQDINDLYQKSLKGYGGPAGGTVGF